MKLMRVKGRHYCRDNNTTNTNVSPKQNWIHQIQTVQAGRGGGQEKQRHAPQTAQYKESNDLAGSGSYEGMMGEQ